MGRRSSDALPCLGTWRSSYSEAVLEVDTLEDLPLWKLSIQKKNSFCKIFTHPTQRSLPSLLRIFNNIEILLYDLSPSQYLLYFFIILWHFLFIWRASCYEDLPSWSQTIIKKTLFSLTKFWTASNFQYLIFLRNPVSDSTFILISNFLFNFKMWLQFILIINCCKIYEL